MKIKRTVPIILMMNMKQFIKAIMIVLINIIAASFICLPDAIAASPGSTCGSAGSLASNTWDTSVHAANGEVHYWQYGVSKALSAGKVQLNIDVDEPGLNTSSVSWVLYKGTACSTTLQSGTCSTGTTCDSNWFNIVAGDVIKAKITRTSAPSAGSSYYDFRLYHKATGMAQFKSDAYSVAENVGSIKVYVSRTTGSSGALSVDYSTVDGTAKAGSDYTSVSGALSWADGDSVDKYIDINIIDDSTSENSESFTVNLSSATGTPIGNPSTTTVTITGPNDSLPNLEFQTSGEEYNVTPGDTVNFNGIIRNNGLAEAGPANHRIYLMVENYSWSNITYDPKRDKLLKTFSSPTINPGGTYSFSIPVVIPANLAPGWDFMAAIELDYDNQIAETIEKNSTSCGDNCSLYPLFGDPSAVAANFALRNNSPKSGDPVNTALGNFIESKQDLFLRGRGLNINFTRHYNSLAGLNSSIGHSWNHTYNIYIHFDAKNAHPTVVFGDGRRISYQPNGSGGYAPIAKGIYDTLVKNADGTYVLTQKDQIKYNFNTNGRLETIVDRNGNTISLNYTGNNLTSIVDTVGRTVTLTYHPAPIAGVDRIESVSGPIRPAVTYGYDDVGNLTTVTDARGYTTNYEYATGHEDRHLLAKITDPLLHDRIRNFYGAATGTEDGHGYFVVRQLDADNKETRYVYNAATRTTSVFGPGNLETKHEYDDQYRFIKETDPMNGIAEFRFDANGNQDQVKDKRLKPTDFTYDAFGNVLTKTDAAGNITKIEYNAFNDPTKKVEGYGTLNHTWTYEYDAKGNLKKETDPEGGFVTYDYNAYGQVVTRTDQNMKATQYFYEDSWGNLTRTVGPAPTSVETVYTYDAAGRRTKVRDGLTYEIVNTYDHNDNVLSMEDPENYTTSFTYDANNNKKTTVNPRGKTTTYVYDVKDRQTQILEPLGKTTTINYDAYDRKTRTVDEWGNQTNYGYDNMGNLTSVTNANTETTIYGYDANGNKTSMTDADGRLWEFTNDNVNRPLCQKDPLNNQTCNAYFPNNPRAWVKSVTDANAKVTSFTYDKTGRLLTVLDPEGGQTVYTYDKAGNRLTEQDARLNTVQYTYDELNRLTKITDRNNKETVFTYDSVNKTARRDGNGITTNYGYYKNGLLKTMTYPAPYATVTFTYDQNGNRLTMIDSLGTTSYTYDDLDRLLSVTDPYGKTVSYAYDTSVQRRTLTYPGSGKTVVNNYDPLGRLSTVTDWLGYTTTYSYTNLGHINYLINTKGTRVDYSYDIAGRLTGMTDKTSTGATISSFQYTALDPVGNRKNASVTLPLNPAFSNLAISGLYDPENQVNTWGTGSYTFDQAGRQIAKADDGVATSYSFNPEDRLTNTSVGTVSTENKYNGLGDRLARSANGVETRYVLDHSGDMTNILMETDAAGNAVAYYVHGAGLLYRLSPTGERLHYHFDPVGSTLALTDTNENMTDKYAYDPFGKLMNKTGSTANPFQYVGQYGVMNENNGLLFMRARFYDPETKRFLSRDPVKGDERETMAHNLYLYSFLNPLIYSDPSGLMSGITTYVGDIQQNETEKSIGRGLTAFGVSALGFKATLGLAASPFWFLAPITALGATAAAVYGTVDLVMAASGNEEQQAEYAEKARPIITTVGNPATGAPAFVGSSLYQYGTSNGSIDINQSLRHAVVANYVGSSVTTAASPASLIGGAKFTYSTAQFGESYQTYAGRKDDTEYISATRTPYAENNRKIKSIKNVRNQLSPKTASY